MELSLEAKRAQNEYHKRWREANKDKMREIRRKHWEKQGKKLAESQKMKGGNEQ